MLKSSLLVYNESEKSSKAAKLVIVKIFTELLKMLAPFIPHTAEEVFQESFRTHAKEKSIHLEKWPSYDEKLVNEEAEKAGEIAKNIIGEIRKYKSEKKMALNAQVASMKVKINAQKGIFEKVREDIAKTMNVSKITMEKSGKEGTIEIEID